MPRKIEIQDYQAVQPRNRTNTGTATTIPRAPRRLRLATIRLNVQRGTTTRRRNTVELLATVGVRGVRNIAQLVFRVFRDNVEIFRTQQGVESAGSEEFYTIAFQAIDLKPRAGTHRYTLTVENATANTTAQVVGPINFSGKVIERNTTTG
ncbi:exosporium protein C [Tumebacillus algifaecis]|uniref:Exosporium protein C n=1 Tax=Tumebacillus algifaecis TaxID=1214604 RepID=A0A223CWH0_9BACL|nr:exosporium protein C [Tumebacillus algifaecis]ASS73641.1 exosporium protein C [Tumebacillus algifaecis]